MAGVLYIIDSFDLCMDQTEWICAHMAQLVEHVLGKDEVTGSIPVVGSSFLTGKLQKKRKTDVIIKRETISH